MRTSRNEKEEKEEKRKTRDALHKCYASHRINNDNLASMKEFCPELILIEREIYRIDIFFVM